MKLDFIMNYDIKYRIDLGGLGGGSTEEFAIIEPVLQQLETRFAKFQGINMESSKPMGVAQIPRFAQDPYIITTFLLEAPSVAKSHAEREFTEFRREEDPLLESDFDRAMQQLPTS